MSSVTLPPVGEFTDPLIHDGNEKTSSTKRTYCSSLWARILKITLTAFASIVAGVTIGAIIGFATFPPAVLATIATGAVVGLITGIAIGILGTLSRETHEVQQDQAGEIQEQLDAMKEKYKTSQNTIEQLEKQLQNTISAHSILQQQYQEERKERNTAQTRLNNAIKNYGELGNKFTELQKKLKTTQRQLHEALQEGQQQKQMIQRLQQMLQGERESANCTLVEAAPLQY